MAHGRRASLDASSGSDTAGNKAERQFEFGTPSLEAGLISMEQRSPRIRWFVVFAAGVVWIGVLLLRLTSLQIVQYAEFLAKAHHQQQHIRETLPKRGSIYDRNGHELAVSLPVDYCFADRSEITDPALVARLLAGVLGVPAEDIDAKLVDPHPFPRLARKLSPETADRIEALNLRGIYVQKEPVRVYPQRTLASHVLGYVDVDEQGLGGIEYSLDKLIRGMPGHMLVTEDARQRSIDRREAAAQAGASVTLTLDENIQYIAEKELAAAIEETHATSGSVVVQSPNTGELLAIANWPTFDSNEPSAYSDDVRMDRAVTAAYEPGSTFKLITLSSALEHGLTRPSELVDCQMGSIVVARRVIHDWHPFGILTVEQVLAHSSDVGAIKIGLKVGPQNLYQTARKFGIGQLTNVDLPGENHGLLRRVEDWSASSIGSIAIGQEVSVTPVQLITAVSAIANGGLLYHPHVVKQIGGPANPLEKAADNQPEPRRVIDPKTAATVRQMMESVILEGTGKPAAPEGYTAAGKSGTAQKINPATGRYFRDKYVTSFVGFAPVNEPAVTILIVLDSPVGAHHGGEVAGPVFRRIAGQVLAYLDVPHDIPVAPAFENTARLERASPSPAIDTASTARNSAATSMPPSEPPLPSAASLGDAEGISVPSLSGQSVRGVTETCSRLGLTPVLIGTGVALQQSPEAGERVLRGSRVIVTFGRPGAVVPVTSHGNGG